MSIKQKVRWIRKGLVLFAVYSIGHAMAGDKEYQLKVKAHKEAYPPPPAE